MIPERISHYQILRQLGSGGMGEVYLAEDTVLGRTVALKILPAGVAADPGRLRRFVHEARAASALKHGNIAGIYELGEAEGLQFIVMEHVEGDTLEAQIKGRPMEVPQILDLAMQIADALEEAHGKGVVHRDIKPQNIMITPKGQAKILDFGLAKMTLPAPEDGPSKIATQTGTEPGLVMGTVQYMSPEQALGKSMDHRTDLFSLGVVLYQMTTGRLPFAAESSTQTINRIVHSMPDAIARYNYACPPELERIIRKCLEKEPENRYQSAHELVIDLRNLKRDTESRVTAIGVRPQLHGKRSLWWMVGLGLLVIGVAAVVMFRAARKQTTDSASAPMEEKKRKMIAVLPFKNLGASDDTFFAEGMTDEITSRLATVPDLGVISRSSAMLYQETNKPTKQIGKELGVDYLLEGTIRWNRSGNVSRVRVTPQLIRVSDDTQLWSNIYDHVINDVFEVQSDIAKGVIAQLGITLGEAQQKALTSAPTNNLEAYQVYLRANEAMHFPVYDETLLRQATQNYQRAVELDPQFAMAYAQLARTHLVIFHEGYDPSPERLEMAKLAVDKAMALNPDLPAAYIALGFYHYHGQRDYTKALEAFSVAIRSSPNDTDALASIAFVERRQGKFEDSVRHLKAVIELEPRLADLPVEVGVVLVRLRRYAEAETYFNRSIELVPNQCYAYSLNWMNIILWKGDLAAARPWIERMPQTDVPICEEARIRSEILSKNYQAALNLLDKTPVEVFQQEAFFMPKILMQAMIYDQIHEKQKAQEAYASAIQFLEAKRTERSNDAAIRSALGIAYAGAGRKQDAIREGKRATELLPFSKDSLMFSTPILDLIRIYVMTGEYDAAFDQIEYLLSTPSWFSIGMLKVTPLFDPLRNHPRYQRIISKQ